MEQFSYISVTPIEDVRYTASLAASGAVTLVAHHGEAPEGAAAAVRLLLDARATVDAADSEGTTPMLCACRQACLCSRVQMFG